MKKLRKLTLAKTTISDLTKKEQETVLGGLHDDTRGTGCNTHCWYDGPSKPKTEVMC